MYIQFYHMEKKLFQSKQIDISYLMKLLVLNVNIKMLVLNVNIKMLVLNELNSWDFQLFSLCTLKRK